jgi:flagellar P-ring protein precursor FlgI
VISQGDIRVQVSLDDQAPQPQAFSGLMPGRRGLIVTNTKLQVTSRDDAVASFPNTTVGDLVQGLRRVHVDTRGIISILQAMKAEGALHADLIVQ